MVVEVGGEEVGGAMVDGELVVGDLGFMTRASGRYWSGSLVGVMEAA